MKRIRIVLTLAIAWGCCAGLLAQVPAKKWEFNVFAGYNLGGSTPMPLPAEIRKINSWSPGFSPTLAFHATRWINSDWGLTSGLEIDIKGMTIDADVKYWYTDLVVGSGEQVGNFSGTFSGKNKTKVMNGYITIPVLGTYRLNHLWTFHAGGYVSLLQDEKFEGTASDGYIRNGGPTGEIVKVTEATYDFSNELRKVDAGIMAAADWNFTRRMAVKGQLSWGLVPLFPSDFKGISYKMYNIYMMLGLAYRL